MLWGNILHGFYCEIPSFILLLSIQHIKNKFSEDKVNAVFASAVSQKQKLLFWVAAHTRSTSLSPDSQIPFNQLNYRISLATVKSIALFSWKFYIPQLAIQHFQKRKKYQEDPRNAEYNISSFLLQNVISIQRFYPF